MFAIAYFRRHFDHPGRLWSFASKNFYGAFILQAPVIVTVAAVLLSSVNIESLLKFGLAAVMHSAPDLVAGISCQEDTVCRPRPQNSES